ncbi:MAG: polysaccharide deacetylase family protein [Planctomycetes bacterium]|nr:polysaccharide deacetylase family protein [Planctomycetota bacterium]
MKVAASISVDIDSLSCYHRAYGLDSVASNAVYSRALPRLAELLDEFGIRATFFVVANDVVNHAENAQVIRRLSDAGHEIANHTMTHPFRITGLPRPRKIEEIAACEGVLSDLTGRPVAGFRSPGWDIDAELFDILEERGYEYDSSIFPSSLLVPLKVMHRLKNMARVSTTGMGSPWFSVAPTRPYRPDARRPWRRGTRQLVEIPVGVVPDVRLPFLGTFLVGTGWGLFRASLAWMVARRNPFTFSLHPIELLGIPEDGLDPRLARQPGVAVPLRKRRAIYRKLLATLKSQCRLVTVQAMARESRLEERGS